MLGGLDLINDRQALLRRLPAVDIVLKQSDVQASVERFGHPVVVAALRGLLDEWRGLILSGVWRASELEAAVARLSVTLQDCLEHAARPSLRPVVNATGVVIHTNLGRSLLADCAKQQIADVASTYSTLEVDVESGERGSRYEHVRELLLELTGAEDALVVNNNAGAVLLTLAALARGQAVIVSRGQLVEIGGSFRIPEVMEQSGCRLVEVGTTNKTHLHDYARAISSETAALLKVHTSNYRVIGFTEAVAGESMAGLAHEHGLLAIEDLGSGVLLDLERLGHVHEPTVQESLQAGMDLVTFSGDKLLGGPQAGIIVGRRDVVSRLRQHPLTRALRIDKLTLAGLEATLRLYRDPARAIAEIPTLRMLALSAAELKQRAIALRQELASELGGRAEVAVVDSLAQVGGGSLPGYEFPSAAISVRPQSMSSDELETKLRLGQPAVFTRIRQDQVLIDLRTVQPGEIPTVQQALLLALGVRA